MARSDKVAEVAELAEEFRSSTAVVLTEYRGLSMAELSTLRRSLGRDVTYTVVKNTLARRAAAAPRPGAGWRGGARWGAVARAGPRRSSASPSSRGSW